MGKISNMDPAGPLTGAELIEVVQDGGSKKALLSDVITSGKDGTSIRILGTLQSTDNLPNIGDSKPGDSWIIGADLHTLVEDEWRNVGVIRGIQGYSAYDVAVIQGGFPGTFEEWIESLKGHDGIGLRIMGSLADISELPNGDNLSGDCWIIAEAMYVWDTVGWAKVGQVGPSGKSAYELAVSRGYQGTLGQWLNSLVGLNNYQLAITTGFSGTLDQYLASLVGPKGDKGDDGPIGPKGLPANAISVLGKFENPSELPPDGNAGGDGYYIQGHLWLWNGVDWEDLGVVQGLSAYQLAVEEEGFVGTLAQWLDSIKGKSNYDLALQAGYLGTLEQWLLSIAGPKGDKGDTVVGPKGDPGQSLIIAGKVAAVGNLPDATTVPAFSAWIAGQNLYVVISGAWVDCGTYVGPKGDQGDEGPIGPKGDLGAGLSLKGKFDTVGELPALGNLGDGYLIAGHFWGWDGAEWIDLGVVQGPPGPEGPRGPKGDTGNAMIAKGIMTDPGLLNAVVNPQIGWTYMVRGHLWSYNGTGWINLGDLTGPAGASALELAQFVNPSILTINDFLESLIGDIGPQGPAGQNFKPKGHLALIADLNAVTGMVQGDGYIVGAGDVYSYDGTAWVFLGNIVGPQGNDGPMGPGITIVGKLVSSADLPGSGTLGQGYLIGQNFWGWTGAAYENLGPIKGDKGDKGDQGIQGIQGLRGFTGDKGDVGTAWVSLARDPGPIDGRRGDYYLNTASMEYFRKSTDVLWVSLGHMGGGNVYSPSNDGKLYAREYDQWVEITVLEALVDGNYYARKDGAWVKVDVLEAPKDSKLYGRENGTWFELPVIEAPLDGKQYIRKNGAWLEVVIPGAGLTDAPSDGGFYTRKNGAWVAVPVAEAPSDGKQYIRKNGAWVEVVIPAGLADAPNDTTAYGRKGLAWVAVLQDAPNDANGYMRKGGAWAIVPAGIAEAPNDANQYVRKGNAWIIDTRLADAPSDGTYYTRRNGAWTAAPAYLTDAPNDANTYGRKGLAWAIIPASLADAPNDTNYYARKGAAWATIVPGFADAASDGKQYLRKNGAWVSLDVYDLKMNAAAAGVLDLAIGNVWSVANSTATTISFKAGTVPGATRTMTVVLVIQGAATITWPTITWSGGATPTLGASTTIVTLLWDGTKWIGTVGASV
jgi:hypothetical protein